MLFVRVCTPLEVWKREQTASYCVAMSQDTRILFLDQLRGRLFRISLVLLGQSWQTWAYFKAEKLLYRTRESTGTRESRGGESTSPKSWTRSSSTIYTCEVSARPFYCQQTNRSMSYMVMAHESFQASNHCKLVVICCLVLAVLGRKLFL